MYLAEKSQSKATKAQKSNYLLVGGRGGCLMDVTDEVMDGG